MHEEDSNILLFTVRLFPFWLIQVTERSSLKYSTNFTLSVLQSS